MIYLGNVLDSFGNSNDYLFLKGSLTQLYQNNYMSVSLQKHKSALQEINLMDEDKKDYMNPISKNTFESLPRIYGKRKKKKYAIKYCPDEKSGKDQTEIKESPAHKCIANEGKPAFPRGLVAQSCVETSPINHRFKTEMRSYDKKYADKLSQPRKDVCDRRYCFCNKIHNNFISRSQNKSLIKSKAIKSLSIRLPQLERLEPDDIQSKHKVAMSSIQSKQAETNRSPFSLLDLLRSSQRNDTFRNQNPARKKQQPLIEQQSEMYVQNAKHAQSVSVQTQNEHQVMFELKKERTTEPINYLTTHSQRKVNSVNQILQNNLTERQEQNPKQFVEDPKKRLERLRQEQKGKQYNASDSDDDSQSMGSQISSNSLSKYIFEDGKRTNTMFQTLNNKQKSIKSSSGSKRINKEVEKVNQKFTYQKKNGLFIIPQEDQFVTYLKGYEPMNEKFKIKKLVRKQNFQVLKSDEGIFFGEMLNSEKNGKGIMVTQKNIFEGNYKNDIKTYGCEKNVDGVYRGEFVNGLREGYGTFEWYNGETFEGEWKKGTKNGFGVWKSPKGDFYEGDWLLNRQHGKGTYKHRLSTYRGYFLQFLKHGSGEQIFSNGDRYFGQYKQGKPHGKGKYLWADGSYYQGDFLNGVRQGKGVWKYANGTVFEGQFKKDFKQGYGVERYKSGQYFEGSFKEGSKFDGILYDLNNNAIKITHTQ